LESAGREDVVSNQKYSSGKWLASLHCPANPLSAMPSLISLEVSCIFSMEGFQGQYCEVCSVNKSGILVEMHERVHTILSEL